MLGLVRRRAAACLVGLVGLRSLALTATTYSTPSGRVDRPSDIVATSGHKGSNHLGGSWGLDSTARSRYRGPGCAFVSGGSHFTRKNPETATVILKHADEVSYGIRSIEPALAEATQLGQQHLSSKDAMSWGTQGWS
jgi:hypothetical protein